MGYPLPLAGCGSGEGVPMLYVKFKNEGNFTGVRDYSLYLFSKSLFYIETFFDLNKTNDIISSDFPPTNFLNHFQIAW